MRRVLAVGLGVVFALALLAPAATLAAGEPPPNDNFANATPVTAFPFAPDPLDLASATYGEPGERTPQASTNCSSAWVATRSVWYRIVPSVSGTLTVSASGFADPRIADYFVQGTDSLAGLSPGICAPDAHGTFPIQFGRVYYIQVTDAGSGGGTLNLTMELNRTPTNDGLGSAKRYQLPSGSSTPWQSDAVDISLATSEGGEPLVCEASARTVWYTFTPSTTGRLAIDTTGSTVAGSALIVYEVVSSGFAGLNPIRCSWSGSLTFGFQAGTTYVIQAADTGLSGNILRVNFARADPDPPVISGTPANISVTTSSAAGVMVNYTLPTAYDSVSGTVPVTCNPSPGALFPIGTTTVKCSAHDAAGNYAYTSFTVRVEPRVAVAPIIPIAAYDVSNTPASGWYDWNHTYHGTSSYTGVGVQAGWYMTPLLDYTGGGGTLNDGWTTGKGDSELFTMNRDSSGQSIEPVIVLHLAGTYNVSSISVFGGETSELEAGALWAATVEIGGATAHLPTAPFGSSTGLGPKNDRIDLTGTPLSSIPTSTIVLRDFQGMLPWGNEYNTFSISEISVDGTVPPADTTPPVLTLPADITAEATSAAGAAVTWSASALDAVDGLVVVACVPESGSTFPLGATTVSCSAADLAGNPATGSFKVTVADTTPPVLKIEEAQDWYAVDAPIAIKATATDIADQAPKVTCTLAGPTTPESFVDCDYGADAWSLGSLGSYTFRATAADAAGNEAVASVSFDVRATYPSVSSLTKSWVSRTGVAKDLVAILASAQAAESRGQLTAEANKLAEYRAAVRAQSGRSIDAAKAQLLITFSGGL